MNATKLRTVAGNQRRGRLYDAMFGVLAATVFAGGLMLVAVHARTMASAPASPRVENLAPQVSQPIATPQRVSVAP